VVLALIQLSVTDDDWLMRPLVLHNAHDSATGRIIIDVRQAWNPVLDPSQIDLLRVYEDPLVSLICNCDGGLVIAVSKLAPAAIDDIEAKPL